MTEWLSWPEENGLYWFSENGEYIPVICKVLSTPFTGIRRVFRIGDDGYDPLDDFTDGLWQLIPEPALPSEKELRNAK